MFRNPADQRSGSRRAERPGLSAASRLVASTAGVMVLLGSKVFKLRLGERLLDGLRFAVMKGFSTWGAAAGCSSMVLPGARSAGTAAH